MRRSIRLALALGLTLGSLTLGACREPTTPRGQTPTGKDEVAVAIQLPDPLPLPEHPKVASWIAQPSVAVAMVAPYSPMQIDLRVGAEQMLANLTEPALAGELARAIDLRAPFSNVVLDDGQEVIRLSLRDDARTSLAGRLSELERVGEFGAVELPRQPAAEGERMPARTREWLAWIDEGDGGTLVLANSLEGLVTGRTLAAAYGREPVFFTLDPSRLPLPIDVPLSRVTGHGDLSAVTIELVAADGQDPLAEFPLAAGTLGGLLNASQISAGASSRYAGYQEVVREVIVQVNSQVAQLPFLVRGIGEGIAAKLGTALRTWDGRVLAAMGPQNHVRLAYGASDVEKSRVAVLRLLQSVVDNVAMARNFSSAVPRMSLRRKVAKADGVDIEVFVLHDASSLAGELRPLVDAERRLNVAMAWSQRAGGGMIVVGPKAADELARWLDETRGSSNDAAEQAQLLAARFAAEPEQLRPLLDNPNVALEQLVGLAATGPRWHLTVTEQGGGKYVIGVTTPGPPKPARVPSKG
ncbi:MAG TPA: hypothetical protein VK034_22935 [Enhygromyxa sp.]|nr:hypothetical protein [Enhygromyxa sp.]